VWCIVGTADIVSAEAVLPPDSISPSVDKA
jgi:hypothetical protein